MMATTEATEILVLNFLERYSGTHKVSEISRMCGAGTRDALSVLEDQKKIRYHVDSDPRFSGWILDKLPEGYVPSLQSSTLPGKIAKFLTDYPRNAAQIIKEFGDDYSESTIRGRLSEMSRAGQVVKCKTDYRLVTKEDPL